VIDFLFATIEYYTLARTVEIYKQILVEVGVFQRGGSLLAQILCGRGHRPPTSFGTRKLD